MSERLSQQRCQQHPLREAAARCPVCNDYFCRECVTEHDDRVLCARCLRRAEEPDRRSRSMLSRLLPMGAVLAGLFVAWLFFFLAGRIFLRMPNAPATPSQPSRERAR